MSEIEIHKQFRLAGIRLVNLLKEEAGIYPSQEIWNRALEFHLELDSRCKENGGYFEPHINFDIDGTIYSIWNDDSFYMIIEFHKDGTIIYGAKNLWGEWEGIVETTEQVSEFFPKKEKKKEE